jgi:hypothetical protein
MYTRRRVEGRNNLQIGFHRVWDQSISQAIAWAQEGHIGQLQQMNHVLQDSGPIQASYVSSGLTKETAVHLLHEALFTRRLEMPVWIQANHFLGECVSV